MKSISLCLIKLQFFIKKKKKVNKLSNISSNRGNSDICNIHVLLKKKKKKKKKPKTIKARHWQFIPKENMSLVYCIVMMTAVTLLA